MALNLKHNYIALRIPTGKKLYYTACIRKYQYCINIILPFQKVNPMKFEYHGWFHGHFETKKNPHRFLVELLKKCHNIQLTWKMIY